MDKAASISAIIADDHSLVRQGVAHLLSQQPDIHVAGQASCGTSALRLVHEVRPDVALLDVEMGEMTGIDAARLIAEQVPTTRTIIFSAHRSRRYVVEAFGAGVLSYLFKDCSMEEMLTAVRAAAAGERYLSDCVVRTMFDSLHNSTPEEPSIADPPPLTPRELQVLVRTAEGQSVKAIASCLGLSGKTVDAHRRRAIEKLGVDSVAGLVKYAIRAGLTSLD